MKKLLIASTALVATAGMAAADGHTGVKLSGYAEMGIADAGGSTGVEFHNDFDVKFTLSGETDNGLTFGATMDFDEIGGGTDPDDNASSVFISGNFGTLTLGDTDGALDFVNAETAMLTSIADDHTAHAGYFDGSVADGANDGQILRYNNTFDALTVALSYEMDDSSSSDDTLGLGLAYTADMGGTAVRLSLGYQDNGTADVTAISVKTAFSGIDVVLNYAEAEDASGSADYMGIGLGYTMGDLSMHVNYGKYEITDGLNSADADGFGLAVNYSLGGGAVVMAGYGSGTDYFASTSVDTFSLGLGLSF